MGFICRQTIQVRARPGQHGNGGISEFENCIADRGGARPCDLLSSKFPQSQAKTATARRTPNLGFCRATSKKDRFGTTRGPPGLRTFNGPMPTIKIIKDLRAIDPVQWRTLLARCPDSTVFQSPEWQEAWWRNCGGAFEPFILAAFEGPHLVGLACLYRRPRTVLGVTRDELQFIGAGQSDYNLFSSMDGSEPVIAALLDELARHIDAGASARLVEIPQSSVTYALLNQRRASGLTGLQPAGTTSCPRLQIEGNGAGVTAVLGKDSLKRHYKALAKLGTIRVEHHTDPAVATSHLAELFRQHIARWENTPFPSLFLDPANQRFYHDMVNSAGAGAAHCPDHHPPGRTAGGNAPRDSVRAAISSGTSPPSIRSCRSIRPVKPCSRASSNTRRQANTRPSTSLAATNATSRGSPPACARTPTTSGSRAGSTGIAGRPPAMRGGCCGPGPSGYGGMAPHAARPAAETPKTYEFGAAVKPDRSQTARSPADDPGRLRRVPGFPGSSAC